MYCNYFFKREKGNYKTVASVIERQKYKVEIKELTKWYFWPSFSSFAKSGNQAVFSLNVNKTEALFWHLYLYYMKSSGGHVLKR